VLRTLVTFYNALPEHSHPAATTLLVAADGVELIVGHMGDVRDDDLVFAVPLFRQFFDDPQARERLSAPQLVVQMLKWLKECFSKVRNRVFIPALVTRYSCQVSGKISLDPDQGLRTPGDMGCKLHGMNNMTW
jgi:hypothetical protein